MLFRRGTILIPSGPRERPDQRHLFVICNEPSVNGVSFLAGVSSWKNHLCDETCILDPGCHPFIRVKSYILYRNCRVERNADLAAGIETGILVQREPMDEAIFKRIVAGIGNSEHTKRRLREDFRRLIGA